MNSSGYSKTPLAKKLGIKNDFTVLLINQPDHYFRLFRALPEIQHIEAPVDESVDFIHLFCTKLEELEAQFDVLKCKMKKDGMFWISWPKGSSKIPKDLDGNIIRRYGLTHGLVDVKVCAVDKDWSGLKFMYRIKDRK